MSDEETIMPSQELQEELDNPKESLQFISGNELIQLKKLEIYKDNN